MPVGAPFDFTQGPESAEGLTAVVIGVRGMLGTDLVEVLRADGGFSRVAGGDLPEVDITSKGSIERFLEGLNADCIFNCAAFTDVDGCESQRELAFAVNGEAAGNLSAVAETLGARLIHVSTDFVFDGRKSEPYVEDDRPGPLSVYGESKLLGEQRVAEEGKDWVIARTAWLYGRAGRNFVDTVLRLAQEKDELVGVTDQVGSPTWARDLAAALAALARSDAQGIFHVVNAGGCSRYEQVQFILDCAGVPKPVKPVDSSAFPRPATVPASSVLSVAKLAREVGHAMRPWQEALREYVRAKLTDAA